MNQLVIDLHTHILPKELPDFSKHFGYGGWVSVHPVDNDTAVMKVDNDHFRDIECNCWDASQRISEIDSLGVTAQVLSTVPVLFNYDKAPKDCLVVSKLLNDDIAKTVANNPAKFIGLGTVPMQNAEIAIEELRRCLFSLGLAGIQIGSHINGQNLDDPYLEPFWSVCNELKVPIFVHPWDMEKKGRMSPYWFPWLIGMPCETTIGICSLMLGGVLERYPDLKICFAHGGGSFPGTIGRIEHGYNCRPDLVAIRCKLSPKNFLNRIWCDSLVHDADTLEFLVKKIGVDKIMLGSDYPFPLGEQSPGQIVRKCEFLSAQEKDKILGLNVLEFLGLDRNLKRIQKYLEN